MCLRPGVKGQLVWHWVASLGFKAAARMVRRQEYDLTAYDLWRGSPWQNPKNQAGGRKDGTTAIANMNRDQRRARARKGGNVVSHGDTEGSDPGSADDQGIGQI